MFIHRNFFDIYLSIIIITFCGFLISCQTATDPQQQPVLTGTVLDPQGNPVSDAMVELEYYLAGSSSLTKPKLSQVNIIIRFAVSQAGPVKVWISRYAKDDTVRVLKNETAMAGNYMLLWDGRDQAGMRVINQIYQSHIAYNGEITTGNLLVNTGYSGDEDPDSTACYTVTDGEGKFEVASEDIACVQNVDIPQTDESGNKLGMVKLSSEIRVWVLHHAHGITVSQKLIFKENVPTEVVLHY